MSTEALRLTELSKSFGGVPAVRGVSLSIADGERRLLLGPNGAGKTTLFNLVTGDLPADAGSIRLFGREISRMRAHRRVHLGLARTYQVITLFPRDTLARNVELALLGLSPLRWNPVALLAKKAELRDRALAMLDRVGLRRGADRRLSETSYGLSQEERRDIQQQLAAIPRQVTVVMIEHDLDVALSFAERITVLHQGQIIVEGNRAEVVADARVQEVYLGA
jgi:branched-chain amino acid transport system ATP-binding protein